MDQVALLKLVAVFHSETLAALFGTVAGYVLPIPARRSLI
jgi:hypothetical protein